MNHYKLVVVGQVENLKIVSQKRRSFETIHVQRQNVSNTLRVITVKNMVHFNLNFHILRIIWDILNSVSRHSSTLHSSNSVFSSPNGQNPWKKQNFWSSSSPLLLIATLLLSLKPR